VVHHSEALARESGRASLPEAVAFGAFVELPERMAELCRYAVKLTLHPDEMGEQDVEALRQVGLDDRDVVDANQVVAYFNYVNRVADGLGVELEEHWPEHLRRERKYGLRGERQMFTPPPEQGYGFDREPE
jgi:uncharacterized peroxidase-related enzyme